MLSHFFEKMNEVLFEIYLKKTSYFTTVRLENFYYITPKTKLHRNELSYFGDKTCGRIKWKDRYYLRIMS